MRCFRVLLGLFYIQLLVECSWLSGEERQRDGSSAARNSVIKNNSVILTLTLGHNTILWALNSHLRLQLLLVRRVEHRDD